MWLAPLSDIAARLIVIAVAFVAAGWLVIELRIVFVPAFAALLATTVLVAPVDRLRNRGWSSLIASLAVMGGALAGASVVAGGLVLWVGTEFDDLGIQVTDGIAEIEDWLRTGPLGLADIDLADPWERLQRWAVEGGNDYLVGGVAALVEVVVGAILAIVFTFFFLKDGSQIVARAVRLLPERHRPIAMPLGSAAWSTLGSFVRGTLSVGVINGVAIGVGLWILGVPLAVPLALLTAMSAFFPLIGAVAAGAVAALVALVSGGVPQALAVIALTVFVQQVEGNVISPVLLGRVLRLYPLSILVAVIVGAVFAGVLGAFLAVPIAAVAASVSSETRSLRASSVQLDPTELPVDATDHGDP